MYLNWVMAVELTIGELAARFGLATHVLRHWEEMGAYVRARLALAQKLLEHGLRCRHPDFESCPHAQAMVRARLDGVDLAKALDHP